MRRATVTLFIMCLAAGPAKAEFVMLSAPDARATHDPTAPDAAHAAPKRRPTGHNVSRPEPALSGFGDRVPLSFAVRQIVPAGFEVAFAEAVDQDSPVDWKGGRPWRATLADALRPLGLVVSVAGLKVTIATVPDR
jgi:hypothetical protein